MFKVSVIIPVLNEEFYLARLLITLKQQKGVELDTIVADAGSTDNTVSIAKEAGARVVKGGLPPVGRNRGVVVAKNETLLFLDADVTFSKTFIKDCLQNMHKKQAKVASVFTAPETKKKLDKFLFEFWNKWIWLTQRIDPHAPGYCIYSTKAIHNIIKGFQENLVFGEDSNYVKRASKYGKFCILHQRIKTSVRRLNTEGRIGMIKKMILCGLHRTFIGEPTNNKFNYHYDRHKKT